MTVKELREHLEDTEESNVIMVCVNGALSGVVSIRKVDNDGGGITYINTATLQEGEK